MSLAFRLDQMRLSCNKTRDRLRKGSNIRLAFDDLNRLFIEIQGQLIHSEIPDDALKRRHRDKM